MNGQIVMLFDMNNNFICLAEEEEEDEDKDN
jgi:hypothetical protein